jgi:hypothetical protein
MMVIFSSCDYETKIVQSWSCDEVLLNQMEAKWNNQKLSNYCFEYSISDVMPDAISGIVTVTDGFGSVELIINGLNSSDDGYEEELKNYAERKIQIDFKSINEIYSYVKFVINNRKQEYESENLIHYVLNIDYDSEISIPSLINETLFYKDDLTAELVVGKSNGELKIKIYNFSIK